MSAWYFLQRLVAFIGLVLLFPLFALLWVVVRGTSRGPFLYSQDRPGLRGKPFRAWKIRTMRPGSDKNLSFARSVSNACPEVTAVGRILRQLKIDELPQLWNIVRGDMAFVGPRPIAFPLYRELCDKIPGFETRSRVRPGLSNVGQVAIEENADEERLIEDWSERFEAELHYLKNYSISYDLVVILLTILYIARKSSRLAWRIIRQGLQKSTFVPSKPPGTSQS